MELLVEDIKRIGDLLPGCNLVLQLGSVIQLLYFSPAFTKIIGFSREEVLQKPDALELVVKTDRKLVLKKMRSCTETAPDISIIYRFHHKTSGFVWAHAQMHFLGRLRGDSVLAVSLTEVTQEMQLGEILIRESDRDVFLVDKQDRTIQYGNPRLWQALHLDADKMLGASCAQYICHHDGNCGDTCVCFQAAAQKKELVTQDHKTGEWLSVQAKDLVWGEHKSLAVYIKNITDIVHQRQELERKNQILQDMQAESARTYQLQLDTVMKLNKEALSLIHLDLSNNKCLGIALAPIFKGMMPLDKEYTADELFETSRPAMVNEQWDQRESEWTRTGLLKMFSQGQTMVSVNRYYELPGCKKMRLHVTVYLMRNPLNKAVEGVFYADDVSEKMLNQRIMNLLMGKNYDCISIVNIATDQFTLRKAAFDFKKIFGRAGGSYSQAVRECAQNYILPEERQEFLRSSDLAEISRQLKDKDKYEFSFRVLQGKKIAYKKAFFAWLDKPRSEVLYISEDVSDFYFKEQLRLEELQKALQTAEQARESKNNFFSTASHDMRTPLNGLLGFLNLARQAEEVDEKNECLDKALVSGEILLQLINDVLNLSKLDSDKVILNQQAYSCRQLAEDALDIVRSSAAEKQISLELDLGAKPLGQIWTDRLRVQQILVNLLSNAIKFTPAGGWVKMSVEHLPQQVQGCSGCITVQDNGIGMSPEFLPHAFDAFAQQLDVQLPNMMGSGLGLCIVKKLVTFMGGFIKLQSVQGQGTTFKIYLPWQLARNSAPALKEEALDLKILRGKRLLLCEDNPINRELTIRILTKVGIKVETAGNGREGTDKFAASPEAYFDFVLMDIRMPVMDGLSAVKLIRKLPRADAKKIPIIALTGDAFFQDQDQTMKAGMNAHLLKPLLPRLLFKTLAGFLPADVKK